MSKEIIFPFRDGRKPVQVGQVVSVTNCNYRRSSGEEGVVTKIGRTFIHIDGGVLKFSLDTGQEQGRFCHNTIYSSPEGYKNFIEVQRKRELLERAINPITFKKIKGFKITDEQVNHIYKYLELDKYKEGEA